MTPASREASHDSDGATGQADDVVSNGADQMADPASCVQPFKSRRVGATQKPIIHRSFPAAPLGVPGEVFQMLRIRMHDVEMGGPGRKNGLLRIGRQPAAKPVLGLSLIVSLFPYI